MGDEAIRFNSSFRTRPSDTKTYKSVAKLLTIQETSAPPADLPMGWSKEEDTGTEDMTDLERMQQNISIAAFRGKLVGNSVASHFHKCFDEGWHIYDPIEEYARMGVPDCMSHCRR